MNEVIVLNEGYSRFEDTPEQEPSAVMLANCTCTLIKGRDCNVIVDTMTPWDGDLLLKRLQEHQLHPDDIDYVVSTHGHSDHLGNNNLFLGAKRHIVGTNISHRNRYYVHDFDNAMLSPRPRYLWRSWLLLLVGRSSRVFQMHRSG